jgi:hypothetical protein
MAVGIIATNADGIIATNECGTRRRATSQTQREIVLVASEDHPDVFETAASTVGWFTIQHLQPGCVSIKWKKSVTTSEEQVLLL